MGALGYRCAVTGARATTAAVVLAAGEGRRFGGPKQLHAIDGPTMLEVVLATVERSGIRTRLVVLGARADRIAAEVPMHGAQVVVSERWADGQAASLRAGLDALPEQMDEALIVLGDGPGLSSEAVTRLATGTGARAADYGHGRSHPVVIPRPLWASLAAAGDTPGRALAVELVDCSDLPEPGDVDYAAP
jgi:CTP:molybdopterin cytidylyltransferase MocA